jgi:TolB-like protein
MGTYVPTFQQPNRMEGGSVSKDESEPFGFAGTWPTIQIKPFLNLTGDAQLDYLGIGLATEVSTEITRCREIRVLLMQHREAGPKRVSDPCALFVMDGNIQRDVSGLKISLLWWATI